MLYHYLANLDTIRKFRELDFEGKSLPPLIFINLNLLLPFINLIFYENY